MPLFAQPATPGSITRMTQLVLYVLMLPNARTAALLLPACAMPAAMDFGWPTIILANHVQLGAKHAPLPISASLLTHSSL